MQKNTPFKQVATFNHHQVATRATPASEQLRRTVLACMLWEKGFYEDGEEIAARIARLVPLCKATEVVALAIEARTKHHLRHAPLLLLRELVRHPQRKSVNVWSTIEQVIQRADELSEFLALYWDGKRTPIAGQVKKGLAAAFVKFDAYALGKYNRDNAVKLRDVLFMVHAKPKDEVQAATWKLLADKQLTAPDTWEVALSAGADKRETFERLLNGGKLGYMALLRNLRNMKDAGVNPVLVFGALKGGAARSRALPFRFMAAARAVPAWEVQIDEAMQLALADATRLPGRTAVLIDVSPSMDGKLSAKSDLTRKDAAAALAILLRGVCDEARVFAFSNTVAEVPPRRGMALADAITKAVESNGTRLGHAVAQVNLLAPECDRLIVFTDEESADAVGKAKAPRAYMVNVATTSHGVGYGPWIRITGFSEAVIQFIQASEGVPEGAPVVEEDETVIL